MKIRSGDTWHCANPSCDAVVLVQAEGQCVSPRCSRGAPMKKKYRSPEFRYLDFLRIDEPELTSRNVRDDVKGICLAPSFFPAAALVASTRRHRTNVRLVICRAGVCIAATRRGFPLRRSHPPAGCGRRTSPYRIHLRCAFPCCWFSF